MKKSIRCAAYLLLSISCFAQEKPGTDAQTKIEGFSSKSGSLLIKRWENIGETEGINVSSASVDVVQLVDAVTLKTDFGIDVNVIHEGAKRANTSFLNYEDIEDLLKGIDYVVS